MQAKEPAGGGGGRGGRTRQGTMAVDRVATGSWEPRDMLLAQGHQDCAFCRWLNTAALHLDVTTHHRGLLHTQRAGRGGWEETFCTRAEMEGAWWWWWKPESRKRARLVFYKASNGTEPTLETQVWPPTHKGCIKTHMSDRSLELCMSISFEARFIINRVSQRTTEFPFFVS